jgi:NAD(P)-dependent dehydrogenase (short-subunit alcohol dehydrogenase family)
MTFEPLDNLNGQVAVISGAGGGIGFATAHALAKSGAQVIGLVRRNADQLQERFNQLPNNQLGHRVIVADNTNTVELMQALTQIHQCDILVNSAGHSTPLPHGNVESLTDEFFDEMLTANLRSVFSTIRTFIPLLKQSTNALVVNIGSTSVLRPGHGSNLAYVAAKAGLEALTKNLALSLAPHIRVVSVCPSSMNTGFLDHPQEFYDRGAAATPLKRLGKPEDIAAAVEACATRLRFTTGNCFVIDGGRTL